MMTKNKQKTHKGAAKRFDLTGTKKIKRRSAFRSHLLEKKSANRKRNYTKDLDLSKADCKNVKRMLGI
jgi:large subunit ribosomal protein L35